MDIKRTILWGLFLVSLTMLWDRWMIANGHGSMFAPTVTAPAAKTSTAPAQAGVPAAAATPGVAGVPNAAPAAKAERITVTTDVFKADIDTQGGDIKRLELLQFRDAVDNKKNVVLFDLRSDRTFLAQTGLIGAGAGGALPNHTTLYTARPGPRSLDGGKSVQLILDAEQGGVKVTKTYTFRQGDYLVDVQHQVANLSAAPIAPSLYMQILHDGTPPETDSMFYSSYTGPTVYTETDKFQKLAFSDIEKNKADHASRADNGWVALVQHFFVSAFVPQDKAQREIFTKKVDTNLYAVGVIQPLGTVAPGTQVTSSARLYSGPQQTELLDRAAPGLDLVKDYGWLTIVAKPMFWVMSEINKVLHNWGWTIIAFTVLIKLAFFPLSAAGYRSMAKMKVVTPKMQAIREKHKADPQKMNMAMMELYKTEKINPLA
ncbi:MAG TPA: membrane protein insertase YidC, partial [Burkholderiaceae bacterium]